MVKQVRVVVCRVSGLDLDPPVDHQWDVEVIVREGEAPPLRYSYSNHDTRQQARAAAACLRADAVDLKRVVDLIVC